MWKSVEAVKIYGLDSSCDIETPGKELRTVRVFTRSRLSCCWPVARSFGNDVSGGGRSAYVFCALLSEAARYRAQAVTLLFDRGVTARPR